MRSHPHRQAAGHRRQVQAEAVHHQAYRVPHRRQAGVHPAKVPPPALRYPLHRAHPAYLLFP